MGLLEVHLVAHLVGQQFEEAPNAPSPPHTLDPWRIPAHLLVVVVVPLDPGGMLAEAPPGEKEIRVEAV